LHVMANSGWSWHLFAAPAVWIAKARRVPVVVNYRGGEAEQFFARSFRWVRPTIGACAQIVVPSTFLEEVFSKRNVTTRVVPNIIDTARFAATDPSTSRTDARPNGPNLLVARNLEAIYDNANAVRAFKEILPQHPHATLTIAGVGPELDSLRKLVAELQIEERVTFTGTVDTQQMPQLYQSAAVMLNPSQVDNMPNSILEALASGVPVVSTNVGGIPYMVKHDETALLVPPRDSAAMAAAVNTVLSDERVSTRLISAGRQLVEQYSWPAVKEQWMSVYEQAYRDAKP
ncbi:MAG: glycosyltransferase family 4 protein, partial [Gammaproteobacteria bacterium]|nr:glycosyltransferase family 4 protein [Gammaproteobacteria bacterium]